MKKLAVLFIVLVSVIALIGCGAKKTETDSSAKSANGTKTTITELKQGDKTTSSDKSASGVTSVASSSSGTTAKKTDEIEFAIISLINEKLTTDKGYHVIEGVTPKNTAKITVNGRALTKYNAGETKWSYIAATSVGNLKKGANDYTIIAFDKSGTTIASKRFTINYTGAVVSATSLASTGINSIALSLVTALAAASALFYLRRRIA